MPFKSEAQRRFLYAKHPEIAKRWAKKYSSAAVKRRLNNKEKKMHFDASVLLALLLWCGLQRSIESTE